MTFKQIESGRSMVEMLGVLAIIGVLSIGGIAGYSYGMNKYRANETINDVNLRAMDVISQLTRGNTPILADWPTTSTAGYPISLATDEGASNYYIRVEKVPYEVCNIISETMPESVEILVDNENEKCAEGENVMDFAYAGFDEAQGGNGGVCPTGTSAEGLGGYAGASNADGNRCYCENAGTKWDSATLTCVAQDGTCSSFADCDKGEYCQFSPSGCSNNNIEIPTTGVCQNLSDCGEAGAYEQFWMSDYGGNCYPDWWTAQDICSAKGMTMVSLSDVGCEDYKRANCPSNTLSVLREVGMTYTFWTADIYIKNNPNYCGAYFVGKGNGTNRATRNTNYNVLCRK